MSVRIAPFLQRRLRFRSRDAEEMRAYLKTQDFLLASGASEARHVDMRVNGVSLPGIYLGYLQYAQHVPAGSGWGL